MRINTANLISNILHPFIVSLLLILLLSFKATADTFDAIKWMIISIALSLLPIIIIIVYLVRSRRIKSYSINIRKERTSVYLFTSICTSISCIILILLNAPSILLAAFVAGFSAVAIFMCINLLWKISLHTAFISAAVTILIILYGSLAIITLVLIPMTAWARIVLKHHTLAQTVSGALLATLIALIIFYSFGLI
ncbi:MAG: phosphatase PAP2 family protein [Dehalococcoidales bacterium]|nr:phosphatase PAP2 family protein [Dehalococcoidales bacterium]